MQKVAPLNREDLVLWKWSIAYRITVAMFLRTAFVPDETFQFVEPGHGLMAHTWIRTWEWESDHKIRSFVPILPYVGCAFLLQNLGIDNASNLKILPRAAFTLLAIGSDNYFLKLCKTVFLRHANHNDLRHGSHHGGVVHTVASSYVPDAVNLAFALHVLSWSLTYCLPRTLGNSLETCFLIIGTALLFPQGTTEICWSDRTASLFGIVKQSRHQSLTLRPVDRLHSVPVKALSSAAICLAATSVYIRPTAVLIWAPLILFKLSTVESPIEAIVKQIIPISLALVHVFVLVDSYLYGQFTIPPVQFYVANVAKGYAAYFGTQPWYWCLSEGLPTVLGLYVPLVLGGLVYIHRTSVFLRVLVALALWYALSLNIISPHMEFRFLLPCLPFLHMLCGSTLHDVLLWSHARKRYRWVLPAARGCIVSGVVLQLVAVAYLIYFHQCGTEEAMSLVGNDIRARHLPQPCDPQHESCSHHHVHIFQAAPCYAFPGYAGLQLPLSGWNHDRVKIHRTSCPLKMEEGMYFDFSPAAHLRQLLQSAAAVPAPFSVDYVLTFDAYVAALNDTLREYGFHKMAELPHAYFQYDRDDPHPKRSVHIFKRQQMRMYVAYTVEEEADNIEGDHELRCSNGDGSTGKCERATSEQEEADTQNEDGVHAEENAYGPSLLPTAIEGGTRTHAPFRSFVAAGGTVRLI